MALQRLRRLFPRYLREWEQILDLRSETSNFFLRPTSKGFVFDVINAAYQKDSEILLYCQLLSSTSTHQYSLVCPELRQSMTSAQLNFCVNEDRNHIGGSEVGSVSCNLAASSNARSFGWADNFHEILGQPIPEAPRNR